jgi:hypothetical protein
MNSPRYIVTPHAPRPGQEYDDREGGFAIIDTRDGTQVGWSKHQARAQQCADEDNAKPSPDPAAAAMALDVTREWNAQTPEQIAELVRAEIAKTQAAPLKFPPSLFGGDQ